MSDLKVLAAIERMEAWMRDPVVAPDPDDLAAWNSEFQAAMATAERGPGWVELVARAQALGGFVESRADLLAAERDAIKLDLDAQARGDRALKGYGASTR